MLTLMHLSATQIWLGVGFLGQALFSMRFFVQWLASEKARKSVIPKAFWFFSLAGGGILLSYAIYRQDPVFIVGQAAGFLIYCRNLYFVYKAPRENPALAQKTATAD